MTDNILNHKVTHPVLNTEMTTTKVNDIEQVNKCGRVQYWNTIGKIVVKAVSNSVKLNDIFMQKRRYQSQCARRVSGITFIRYAQSQSKGWKAKLFKQLWEQVNQRAQT